MCTILLHDGLTKPTVMLKKEKKTSPHSWPASKVEIGEGFYNYNSQWCSTIKLYLKFERTMMIIIIIRWWG